MINARAETLLEKPAYRGLVRSRRCLILADGFYEWHVLGGRKQPIRFTLADGEPFAFAGLWTGWTDKETGEIIESAAIITTRANELVAPVHDRMPVILPREAEELWVDPDAAGEEAVRVLEPYPAWLMLARPASSAVNSVRNDYRDLIELAAA